MNICDYIEWRGDLSFEADPFCEADALIFAWLSYYPAEKLMLTMEQMESLTLKSLYEIHLQQIGEIKDMNVKLNINPTDSGIYLLKLAALSDRFGSVRVLRFRTMFSQEDNTQFAAFTYEYLPRRIAISYRGTDGSVTGWREDFMMCCSDAIPSQHLAREYLEAEDPGRYDSVILCGHSKGGNIAMHALLYTGDETRKHVTKLYNFDGPGFPVPMESIPCYAEVKDRIITILPESSIIGMLMEHEDDFIIIESEMVSMLQHNAMLWSLKRREFIRKDDFSSSSQFIDKALHSWLASLSNEEKEKFVNVTFDALEDAGITDFTDIGPSTIPKIFSLIGNMVTIDSESRKNLIKVIMAVMQAGGNTVVSSLKENELVSSISNGIETVTDTVGKGFDTVTDTMGKAVDAGIGKLKSLFGGPKNNG